MSPRTAQQRARGMVNSIPKTRGLGVSNVHGWVSVQHYLQIRKQTESRYQQLEMLSEALIHFLPFRPPDTVPTHENTLLLWRGQGRLFGGGQLWEGTSFFFLEPSLKDAVQACCQSHPDARDFREQARHPSTLHLDLASQTCPPLYPGHTGTPNSSNHNTKDSSVSKGTLTYVTLMCTDHVQT